MGRKPGVSSPEELAAFVAAAGEESPLIALRLPSNSLPVFPSPRPKRSHGILRRKPAIQHDSPCRARAGTLSEAHPQLPWFHLSHLICPNAIPIR